MSLDTVPSGFYKKTPQERLEWVSKRSNLTQKEAEVLTDTGSLSLDLASHTIENVVGAAHVPFALGINFRINSVDTVIPMATEEPSVVAAACKAAKLCLPQGFSAKTDDSIMIGQIQIMRVDDLKKAESQLKHHQKEFLAFADSLATGVKKYGGGVKDLYWKTWQTPRGNMLVIYLDVNVVDIMGANTINTVLEALAPRIQSVIGGTIRLRILSNLAVKRKAYATAVWKKELIGEEAVEAILDGYELARNDVFRCVTHNKGIMNGVDAVALACGQDFRAIEAGAHSYAAQGGYHSLTHYEKNKSGDLVGSLEMPLVCGIYGGTIQANPIANIALKILGAQSWKTLAQAAACVGLANNFAALYALSTVGIQDGHMKLHARNIAVLAGAKTESDIEMVTRELEATKDFSLSRAREILGKKR